MKIYQQVLSAVSLLSVVMWSSYYIAGVGAAASSSCISECETSCNDQCIPGINSAKEARCVRICKRDCKRRCRSTSVPPSTTPSDRPSDTMSPSATTSPSACVDELGWVTFDPTGHWSGRTCSEIAELPSIWCDFFVPYTFQDKSTYEACCACGGGEHVSIAPSSVSSGEPSAAPTQCVDDPTYIWHQQKNYGCAEMSISFCDDFGDVRYNGKNTYLACCVCGGGIHVGLEPSRVPSVSPSILPSLRPSFEPSTFPTLPPTCVDEPGWVTEDSDGVLPNWSGQTCSEIAELPSTWCIFFKPYTYQGKSTYEACCACGGGDHAPVTPSLVPSEGPSAAPSQCVDDPTYIWDEGKNFRCAEMSASFCSYFEDVWYNGKNTYLACCVCGGGIHVGLEPSVMPSLTPSQYPSMTPSPSAVPSFLPSLEPSAVPSLVPTLEPSAMPSLGTMPSLPSPFTNSAIEGYLFCGVPVYGDTSTSGSTNYYGNLSNEHIYRVVLTELTAFTVETSCREYHTYDTALKIYNDQGEQLYANDHDPNAPGNGCDYYRSIIGPVTLQAGTYFVMVEGYWSNEEGSYEVTSTCAPLTEAPSAIPSISLAP